ncbi:hypothetical protein B4U80_06748 [Leptotrombidium deliense]|uniref:Uncharacterized protein n=1 Tax=Leptotrombidium deliense TaxID=299467 RepID=A0A443RWU7_9ACAR|nr:hypothetical protein B4U80_06748 [Leptotrombidium deliense]
MSRASKQLVVLFGTKMTMELLRIKPLICTRPFAESVKAVKDFFDERLNNLSKLESEPDLKKRRLDVPLLSVQSEESKKNERAKFEKLNSTSIELKRFIFWDQ